VPLIDNEGFPRSDIPIEEVFCLWIFFPTVVARSDVPVNEV